MKERSALDLELAHDKRQQCELHYDCEEFLRANLTRQREFLGARTNDLINNIYTHALPFAREDAPNDFFSCSKLNTVSNHANS